MRVFLSLLTGFLVLNGGNAELDELLTQNCGGAMCKMTESTSCDLLASANSWTGTCCSLQDNDDGTCTVSVSSGICYWEPLAPCEGCAPGTGGKFLASNNQNGCPNSGYQTLPETEPPIAVEADEGSDTGSDEAVAQITEPDAEVSALNEESSTASTGIALSALVASATMLFL
jgi:hypothetical protein